MTPTAGAAGVLNTDGDGEAAGSSLLCPAFSCRLTVTEIQRFKQASFPDQSLDRTLTRIPPKFRTIWQTDFYFSRLYPVKSASIGEGCLRKWAP